MSSDLVNFQRYLKMELPARQSAFLWGARKTGKSTYLRSHFPKSIYYDLLHSDLYIRFLKAPYLFREEILALSAEELQFPIIVDEVQKIPLLLDEIHWLIENTAASFILCGSSARKMKQAGTNLLGGRAWRFNFYPLIYLEIPSFDLLRALNHGLIPHHYIIDNPSRSLRAYIEDYLTQEIQAEGLVRNLPAFARFLDALALSHGEIINFNNIARDCAIDAKTVKEYYQILVDTLLGYFIVPFHKKKKRDIISAHPKFYLFDVGVLNALAKRSFSDLKGMTAGQAFEHYILMELMAYRGLNSLDFAISFWRTKTGLEVDFILGDGEIAIEVKIDAQVERADLRGLIAFQEEHQPKLACVVSQDARSRKILIAPGREILILPWRKFLEMLWHSQII